MQRSAVLHQNINSVIPYCFTHILRVKSIRSKHGHDVAEAMTVRSDNNAYEPKAITLTLILTYYKFYPYPHEL
jgi:hypothetical protein